MHSPDSRAPNLDPKPTCGKGCSEVCADCSGFELEPDWDAGITEPAKPAASAAPAAPASAAPSAASAAPVIAPPETRREDRAWLDGRIADIAAKLEQSIKAQDPTPALDKFSARLDNFEARVEAVVDRAVAGHDPESLRFIEARVREIDDQFDKMRGQIGRLSTIDARVAEIWDHVQLDMPSPTAGLPRLVEGAVSRALAAASVLKAEGAQAEVAEVAAFERIEDALARLIERVEAIEVQAATPEPHAEDPDEDIDLINRAYEEGARALGLIMPDAPSAPVHTLRALHAANYAPRPGQDYVEPATFEAAVHAYPAPSVAPVVEQAPVRGAEPISPAAELRESFRASALRAKQRAQAEAEMFARALPAPSTQTRFSESRPEPSSAWTEAQNRPVSDLFPAPDAAEPPASSDDDEKPIRASAVARARRAASVAVASAKRPLSQGRWNRGFFLVFSMLVLGGGSYFTVDRLLAVPGEHGARSLSNARLDPTTPTQQIAAPGGNAPVERATPAALPPDDGQTVDVSGAAARAAALPATIASASLRHAAANGDPAAEFEIGSRYSEGRGVTSDLPQAFIWYQRAASHGFTPAQFRLGALYERGIGVEKDPERAKVWYRRASEKGHAKAMHNLAVLLSSGPAPDMAQAARWFREAAERNLADSQYNLASLHEAGQGVDKNLAEAFKWYALAARSGDAEAAKRLDDVRGKLSKGEIASAEKAVKSWLPVDMVPSPNAASVPERAAP